MNPHARTHLAAILLLVLTAALPATPLPVDPKQAIAWGKPQDDVRIGLASDDREVLVRLESQESETASDDQEIKVTLWYENAGKDVCPLVLADRFRCPFGFVAIQNGRTFDVPCHLPDAKAVLEPNTVQLRPGELHCEEAVLRFEGADGKDGFGFVRLPRPTEGQPVTLTARRVGKEGNGPPFPSGPITVVLATKPADEIDQFKAYLGKNHKGAKWQTGPARVDSEATRTAFPGQRFYYVASSPPLPPGGAVNPEVVERFGRSRRNTATGITSP
jgi:hypothetical protein